MEHLVNYGLLFESIPTTWTPINWDEATAALGVKFQRLCDVGLIECRHEIELRMDDAKVTMLVEIDGAVSKKQIENTARGQIPSTWHRGIKLIGDVQIKFESAKEIRLTAAGQLAKERFGEMDAALFLASRGHRRQGRIRVIDVMEHSRRVSAGREATAPLARSKQPLPAARAQSVNSRMLETIQSDHSAYGWSAKRWKTFLKCNSEGTVKATAAWKTIMSMRAAERLRSTDENAGRSRDRKA